MYIDRGLDAEEISSLKNTTISHLKFEGCLTVHLHHEIK